MKIGKKYPATGSERIKRLDEDVQLWLNATRLFRILGVDEIGNLLLSKSHRTRASFSKLADMQRGRPVTPFCKIFRSLLEKCVGHSLKLLDIV